MRKIFLYVFICYLTAKFYECAKESDPDFPDINKLMQNGFIAQIEISSRPQGETIYVTEYYYGGKDQTRIDILRRGKRETIYYYPKQDQLVIIKDYTCKVEKAGTSDYLLSSNFTNWLYSPADSNEVYFGPSSLLRSAAENTPTYEKTDTIRGINCHKFLTDNPSNSEVTNTYYFTNEKWVSPANVSGGLIPIRIELGGEGTDDKIFLQTIEYVFFRPSITQIRLLEPHTGLGCKGLLNQGPEIPPITKRFTVIGEFYNETANQGKNDFQVTTFRAWYDYKNKLSRIDVNTKDDRGISTILDFNTGLMYRVTDGKNCDAEPISDSSVETFKNGFSGVMKDPKELLELDGTFYYLGKTFVRGIYCDIWESVKENIRFNHRNFTRIVFTYYYTSHLWEIEVDGTKEEQVPVRIEMNMYDKPTGEPAVKTAYNLFSFNKYPPPRFTPYNILGCAGVPSQKTFFLVTYTVSMDDVMLAEELAPMVKTELEGLIPSLAQISPLRLPFLQIDFEPEIINVMGLVLERVPALKQFNKLDAEDKPKNLENEVKATSEEDCASACVDADTCTAFHFCGNKCFISLRSFEDNWGTDLDASSCYLYIRIEQGSNNKDVPLETALKNIEKAVKNKTLVITLEKEEDGNTDMIVLKPEEFFGDISPFAVGDHDRNMYQVIFPDKTFTEASQLTVDGGIVTSPADCYRKCRDEKSILCSSFSFCGDNNKCLLSPIYASANNKEINNEVEKNTRCRIYSIAYIEMFIQYEGQVSLLSGKKEIKNVETANECAKNCREESGFSCRGFEYCNSEKVCQLHEKHVLDMKTDMSKIGRGCNHYALKYGVDYIEAGRFIIKDPNAKTLSGIEFEECARSCSEKSEFKCLTFNYCTNDDSTQNSCVLNTQTLDSPGVITDSSTTNCKHYAKKKVVDDWAQPRKSSETPKSGYTSGGLTGVIFITLFVGLVLGIAAFMGYSYYKSRSTSDGTTVKFSKHENI